ncbi:MAG TPA: glycosyltransferase family 4 protein [Verrucomicrobiae bacterium]|nr:glycosyltransferase family 4 protein [Verrucomicrobiae bacterium]
MSVQPIRVVVATVYRAECPTLRSRLVPFCERLAKRGYEFTFLVLGEGPPDPPTGIRYRGYGSYLALASLVAGTTAKDADILVACKPYSVTGLLGFAVARLRGIGYLLDVDDRTFPSEINKWWRLPLYVQELLVDRLLKLLRPPTTVASRALQQYFAPHAVYVPNSADTSVFRKNRGDSSFIRKHHGIDGRVIIWPAVFFQETDRHYTLEIFARLLVLAPQITLLLLGDGEYLPEIRRRAEEKGLRNIIFAGAVPYSDMPHYYAAADAGFLPLRESHYDACKGPIKLYEFMAMELPVIATDVGEPAETVRAAGCGVLLPFRDAGEAARRVVTLLESGDLRMMGQAGRRYLESRQSLESLADIFGQELSAALAITAERPSACRPGRGSQVDSR